MNFADLKAEVRARGFDYVDSDTRLGYWINRVYHRACERYPWPFLETSTSGVAPLTVSDVRSVLSVTDFTADTVLEWLDRRTHVEMDPAGDDGEGTPDYWYLTGGGTQIDVHPPNTSDTINVLYVQVPIDLAADDDKPLIPTRYHYLLVDGACALAYADSDNAEMAGANWSAYDSAIEEMANTLMVPNYDSAASVTITGSVDW